MVKKDMTKKWVVLLIVLVALSLVVDLFSLNVLYGLGKNTSSLKGALATTFSECEQKVHDEYQDKLWDLYTKLSRLRQDLYALERIKEQDCDAIYEDLKNSGYCIDRASIEWELADLKQKIEKLNKQYSDTLIEYLTELLKCKKGYY